MLFGLFFTASQSYLIGECNLPQAIYPNTGI